LIIETSSSSIGDYATWTRKVLGFKCNELECSETLAVLELLGLAAHIRLGAGAGKTSSTTEVLLGLSVLGGSEEVNLLTLRGLGHELVQSEALAAGSSDASTGSFGESESGDSHLGDLEDSLVISDGGNNNSGLSLVGLLLGVVLNELGK